MNSYFIRSILETSNIYQSNYVKEKSELYLFSFLLYYNLYKYHQLRFYLKKFYRLIMYGFFLHIHIMLRAKTKIYEKELCNLVILHIHGLKVNVNGRQTFNTFFEHSGFIIKFYHCWYIIKIRFQFMSHLSAITLVRENRENINI